MKYFSEVTKEMYDSVDELEAAEELFLNNSCDNCDDDCSGCGTCDSCSNCKDCLTDDVDNNEKNVEQPSKKSLAAKIDEADHKLKTATAEYELARQQINDLSKTYLESVDKILKPAEQAVKDAERAKYQAIREFNDAYGAYQVTYTGAKAAEEFMRSLKNFNNHSLFKTFGWPFL